MQSSDFGSASSSSPTQLLVLPPPPRYTLTPQESSVPVSVNTPSKKISSIPKGLLWGVIITTVVIALGWLIFFVYAFWQQKYFFAYERPASLPGDSGSPITPNSQGTAYDIPTPVPPGSLKDKVVLLGGNVTEKSQEQLKADQVKADQETQAWNAWTPEGGNPNVSSLAERF